MGIGGRELGGGIRKYTSHVVNVCVLKCFLGGRERERERERERYTCSVVLGSWRKRGLVLCQWESETQCGGVATHIKLSVTHSHHSVL